MKSKKFISATLAALMVTTSVFGFSGCNKKDDKKTDDSKNTTNNESKEEKKDEDQFINGLLSDPETLDVNEAMYTSDMDVLYEVQEPLVRVKVQKDGTNTYEPAAAEKIDISEDKMTYTFHLRDNKWSDGQPVTAQHFVDSLQRLLDPNNTFAYAFYVMDVKNAAEYNAGKVKKEELGIKAIDDKTLEIQLGVPCSYFVKKLVNCAYFPIRLDKVAEAEKDGDKTKYSTDLKYHVYSGPFVIKSWDKQNKMVYERNENYWDKEHVYAKTITFVTSKEFSTQAQLFEAHQIDYSGASLEYLTKWKKDAKDGKFALVQKENNSVYGYAFNVQGGSQGLMANKKVRLAFSLALSRENYLDTLYQRYIPAYSLIPTVISCGEKSYREQVNSEPLKDLAAQYDTPEKLQALLKEGLKELGKEDMKLSDINFVTISTEGNSKTKKEHEYIQQEYKEKLGVNIVYDIVASNAEAVQKRKEGKWDFYTAGWSADFDEPINYLEQFASGMGSSMNAGGYSNKEYDELIKKLQSETDTAKRLEMLKRCEDLVVTEDVVYAPTFITDTNSFRQNYMRQLDLPNFGASFEFKETYTVGRN